MVTTHIKNIMRNMNCMYSREITYMLLVGQVSALVEGINIGIFLDTINVTNVNFA